MRKLILIISLLLFVASCRIFSPSEMLRTKINYKYSQFSEEQLVQEYKIAPFDELAITVSSNNGEKLIGAANSTSSGGATYTVEYDGMVKLPVFGRIKISGLTVREAEKNLEDLFSKFYKDPFIQLRVSNMRVILFSKGQSGSASIVSLKNPNTTLFEALATAGGISGGKAYNIKIIRGDLKNPQVYLVDLSTLEGMKKANLILQANDIIIIKPQVNIPEKFTTFLSPYLSLSTFVLLIFQVFK